MRVVVIGGGVAGLASAWAIRTEAARRTEDVDLVVLEAGPRVGGRIRTTREDGYLVEWAANAIQGVDGAAWRLAEAVGLGGERIVASPEAARRYIVRHGRLHAIPSGPLSLVRFSGLSPAGRLRVAMEPFFARRGRKEESVHDYAARHVGEEAADVLVGAAVRGIFAGDARRLSVDAAFPLLREMERKHRSLLLAMMIPQRRGPGAGGRRGKGGRKLWSLRRGLQSLTDALAERLGPAVRLSCPAMDLQRAAAGYSIRLASGDRLDADVLVLALPARAAAALLRPLDGETGRRLLRIESVGVAVVGLAFRRASFRTPPDGYGFLTCPGESIPALGALFESNLFPDRAREGQVLVRVMIGGAARPELITRADAELTGLAMSALDRTHGLSAGPERTWVIRQEAAIPQYEVGHAAWMTDLDRRVAALPGLFLTGNAYRGVSVGSLIEDAERIAVRVVRYRPGASAPTAPRGASPPSGP